ncbi:hypothetical protein HanXRQr2_Chr04g0157211 [Helianthus annuus]|uniref:Uncharacterized protein n=2 Tax=Helianthus annuus TaxID=4232 RepID=A0A9K3J6S4_HELAN|nr:hypothetical protein HanXRQr2_Chr04g0157211 [Helianthus annuus]
MAINGRNLQATTSLFSKHAILGSTTHLLLLISVVVMDSGNTWMNQAFGHHPNHESLRPLHYTAVHHRNYFAAAIDLLCISSFIRVYLPISLVRQLRFSKLMIK